VAWRQTISGMLLCLPLLAFGVQQPEPPPPALRAAVPLLCTENIAAFRTFVRGTGLIADSGGTLLTAAHVILQAHFNCTLSVMIPDDEWIHAGHFRRFLLTHCHLNEFLDLAVCRLQPADNPRDLGYIHAAPLRFRQVTPGEPVSVTGFTGWVLAPLTRSGRITGQEDYRRQDGCRCDFATNIVAVEGMSGSPVISPQGEVLGIITQAGKGRFRGTSFGVSFEDARNFLIAEGVVVPASPHETTSSLPSTTGRR
jgi:S1-C subfamily serine protease